MECLDELTILDLFDGRLPSEQADAVESHVDKCSDCRTLLAALVRSRDALPACSDLPLVAGEQCGRFLILTRVGAGGMGEVYAAWDPELDRKVALKVVASDAAEDARAQERLVREARATAAVSHPNVITVYDVGRIAGRMFIAMEYMDGGTLGAWLALPPVPTWRQVLARFAQAGAGVAAAHRAGLVHRDFKPDNVLLDRNGHVRVTDFGLARIAVPTEPAAGPLSTRTRPAGTPSYMAPEQLRGSEVTSSADQFSFCVSAWDALFGERPFAGQTMGELHDAIEARALRPGHRGSDVPAAVRRALERGLDPEPAHRWPSMDDLLAALARAAAPRRTAAGIALGVAILGGAGAWLAFTREDTRCDPAPLWSEGWGADDRERLRATWESTGAPYATPTFERFRERLDAYVERWSLAWGSACSDDYDPAAQARMACLEHRRDQAIDLVQELDVADRRRIQLAIAEVVRLHAIEDCDEPAPVEDTRVTELDDELRSISRMRRFGAMDEAARRLDAIAPEVEALGDIHLRSVVAMIRGHLASAGGELEPARRLLDESARLALISDRPEILVGTWVALANIDDKLGRPDWADHWLALAEAAADRLGAFTKQHVDVMFERANIARSRGDMYAAAEQLERLIPLVDDSFGADHPDALQARTALAMTLTLLGRVDEAVGVLDGVLEAQIEVLGEIHPDVATTLETIGGTLSQHGRHAEALGYQERAIAVQRAAAGDSHPELAYPIANYGLVLMKFDPRRALALLDEAERLMRPTDPALRVLVFQRGHAHHLLREHETAVEVWRDLLAREGQQVDREVIGTRIHLFLARSLAALGRFDEAHEELRRASEVVEAFHGESHLENMFPDLEDAYVSALEGKPDVDPFERALLYGETKPLDDYAMRVRYYYARALIADGGSRERAYALALEAHAGSLMEEPHLAEEVADWLATRP